MNVTQRDRDLGTAYALKPPATRTELTSVARFTPMGELLRRYWHPVGLSRRRQRYAAEVRALGEDLILFRDRQRPGRASCSPLRHRGATLYYGKVEEAASAAATTAGNSTSKAIASNSPASPRAAVHAKKCASRGTPCRSATA